MKTINMLSSSELVKGQGVGSAFIEQVNLVSNGLKDYKVVKNSKKKADILHFHTIDPQFFLKSTMNSSRLRRKKSATVGYVHFLPETVDESLNIPKIGRKAFYKYMIDFYDKMDYLVTVNPVFIKKLEECGINSNKVTYIPNFVSDEKFYAYDKEKKDSVREEYNIPKDKFVVVGVGQVQRRKGVFDFIETALKMPDTYFVWAGGFSFGPLTDGYKELKEVMENPPKNVCFLGIIEREKMNDIYNMADCLFLPSYNELFPMTILESMCTKKPILLRDLDIYPDILFDYYLKGNEVDDFARIIKKLSQDKDFYDEWSKKSYEGHKFYSKENVLVMWQEFYDKVYDNNKQNTAVKSKRKLRGKQILKFNIISAFVWIVVSLS